MWIVHQNNQHLVITSVADKVVVSSIFRLYHYVCFNLLYSTAQMCDLTLWCTKKILQQYDLCPCNSCVNLKLWANFELYIKTTFNPELFPCSITSLNIYNSLLQIPKHHTPHQHYTSSWMGTGGPGRRPNKPYRKLQGLFKSHTSTSLKG